jgi:sRNA-binding carbon storage regulator CsrA
MMMLTGSADESIIVALDDGSEIEVTIIELEGNKARVMICADEAVSVIRKYLSKSEN